MHPRSVLAIARKDGIDILLNKATVVVLIMPIAMAIFFLVVGKLISGHTTNILVYDPGQSRLVQVVSGGFEPVNVTEASSPADVTAAFGPNGSTRNSAYDIGLIIPANFDSALRAGSHPQVSLYINGTNINQQQSLLLQAAITNYARQVASPQPPLQLNTAVINPPSTASTGNLSGAYYGTVSLLVSFVVGLSLVPGLLIEEKEKKTLRMLMVTPASFTDVILGKLLVSLVYQLLLSGVVLAITSAFTGQVFLVLFYTLLGACFTLALGLLIGGIFSSASTAGGVSGLLFFIYIIPAIFTGPIATLMRDNPIAQIVKILPPYYITDGVYNAMQGQGSLSGNLLDIGVILASTLVLLAITAWVLRRQSAVAATI
ncbi:MAG TPA: ABC transporter permease [Ktedonobacteraceae bacterium]|nr:ABC transporter permease [Ktedonobacteraceae bacterium]